MTYDIYRMIFIVCAILSIVMLVVSIILFIALKIPTVIGDLTGANARKAIANIRSQNANAGDAANSGEASGRYRGALTDKITHSGNLLRAFGGGDETSMMTSKISTQKLMEDNVTTLLSNETTVLSNNETTVLNATAAPVNETTVLSQEMVAPVENVVPVAERAPMEMTALDNIFEIEFEITFVHTNEIIA